MDQRKKIINCVTEIEQKNIAWFREQFQDMSEDNTRRKRGYPSKTGQSSASKAKDQWCPSFTFIWKYVKLCSQSIELTKYNRNTSDIVLPDLEFKPNEFSTNVLRSMFGTFEDNETCQKSSIKLDPL